MTNGTVPLRWKFSRKIVIAFEVLPFSRFYRNDRNLFVWITIARLHVERKQKIYWYFVDDTIQPRPCFRCKKNNSTIWRKFFTEISVQMVSAPVLCKGVTLRAKSTWASVDMRKTLTTSGSSQQRTCSDSLKQRWRMLWLNRLTGLSQVFRVFLHIKESWLG